MRRPRGLVESTCLGHEPLTKLPPSFSISKQHALFIACYVPGECRLHQSMVLLVEDCRRCLHCQERQGTRVAKAEPQKRCQLMARLQLQLRLLLKMKRQQEQGLPWFLSCLCYSVAVAARPLVEKHPTCDVVVACERGEERELKQRNANRWM